MIETTDTKIVAPPSQRASKDRISKRLRQAIALLESGECRTQKAAASRVGMNEQHLCRSLKHSNVQAFIARKRAENIAVGSLQASYRYPQLVFADSEHVAEKASARLLEQTGDLRSASGGINVSVNNTMAVVAGYVVDVSPQPISHGPSTIDQD